MKLRTLVATASLLLASTSTLAERVISPPPYTDMQGKRLSSVECLTVNSYQEGRGESDIANLMIMSTVVNRIGKRNYGNSICEVVFKKGAYSWADDHKSDKIKDINSYKRLYKLAEEFIIHRESLLKISQGINHYHTTSIHPYWAKARGMEYVMTIDHHKFYKYRD